jgi:hypothetical protein
MKRITICIILFLISISVFAQFTRQKEEYYRDLFAKDIKGNTEVILSDKTRADIVTDTFAIEVEFAENWAESIGQSLYYANELNKKPGILLVIHSIKDEEYIRRLMSVTAFTNIKVWIMDYTTLIHKKVAVGYFYSYQ